MSKTFVRVVVLSVFAMIFTAGNAFAGDCKQVKFKFTNSTAAKVKVKNIRIQGNDGTWTENIGNHQIETNRVYTTNKRRLNKLDSGKAGKFTVNYDRWDAPNNKWKGKSQTFSNQKCSDGKTFSFKLTNK